MNQIEQFEQERLTRVEGYGIDVAFQQQTLAWLRESVQRINLYK